MNLIESSQFGKSDIVRLGTNWNSMLMEDARELFLGFFAVRIKIEYVLDNVDNALIKKLL